MADTLDLSSIFPGMDAETLRRLMAQFQASDADKASARSAAFVDGGLALLANARKGQELEAIGKAGLFGRGTYRSELDNLTKQRGAAITQAGGAFKLGKEISRLDQQNAMLKGDEPAAAAAAPPAPFPHGGTVVDAITGAAPGPDAATPPAPVPTGAAAPTNMTGNYYMRRARELGVEAPMRLALAADSDPFGKAATILATASAPHVVAPGNVLMGGDGRTLGGAPNIGPGMRMGANGVEAIPGFADTTEAIAGATERAKAGQDIVEVPVMDPATGRQTLQKMTRADAAARLSNRQPPAAAPAQAQPGAGGGGALGPGQTIRTSANGIPYVAGADGQPMQSSPEDLARMGLQPDQQSAPQRAPARAPAPQAGFGTTDPVAMEGAKAEATAGGKNLADQRAAIDASAENAMGLKGRIADMRTLVDQFSPNMAAPQRQKLGELAYAFGANKETAEALAGGNVAAMQTFGKQAIQTAFEATRQAMGGQARIAQQEILLQVTANPNIAMTSQGIKTIFNYMEGVSDWQLAKQQAADKYQGEKGSMRGFEAAFNREHPITDYLPSVQELKDSLGVASGAPQLTDAAKGNHQAAAALKAAVEKNDTATIDLLRKKGYVK